METHTTNISDLPIDTTPSTNEMPANLPISTENITLDPSIQQLNDKKVTINEKGNTYTTYNNQYKLNDVYKLIIISTLVFIIFNQPKLKTYIIDILTAIFGNILKEPTGHLSKQGLIIYSFCFGLILYIFSHFLHHIDI